MVALIDVRNLHSLDMKRIFLVLAKKLFTGKRPWGLYFIAAFFSVMFVITLLNSCRFGGSVRTMEVTAYCGCGKCNDYVRGKWIYLKLNFWNRYVSKGPRKGKPYTGLSASGDELQQYYPGLFSSDSFNRPWVILFRLLPWRILPRKGTIAADTRYYPFGTEMYVPGYGWGVVQDRGAAIKGPDRLDLFYNSHKKANKWGRRNVDVKIYMKKE